MLGVPLVFMLALGALLLVGCGGPEEEAASSVVVRVSGAEGTAYSGSYGFDGEQTGTAEDTLGTEPTDYELVTGGLSGLEFVAAVAANFRKTNPGGGVLRVEILDGDEVIAQGETSEELGAVNVVWVSGEEEQTP